MLLFRDDLEALAAERGRACVSIYMPTVRSGADSQTNPIRFKNLLRKAEALMEEQGLRRDARERLLAPGRELLEDASFWLHQSDGFCFLRSDNLLRHFRLPIGFHEAVIVTKRFHLKPLLPLLSENGRFYVLALSQSAVRLIECTRFSEREVTVADMPGSLAAALRFDDPEKQHQFHTRARAGGAAGLRPAVHFGHGVGTDDAKTDVLRFLHLVDDAFHEVVKRTNVPVVLAGVEYLHAIFREASDYRSLVEQGIVGNPDELDTAELRTRGWEVVRPIFEQARTEAVELLQRFAGTNRAATDLEELILGAHDGRLSILFVTLGAQRWGVFDPTARQVETHDQAQPGDEDLLDLAAVKTLLADGSVYPSGPADMPVDAPAAGVFRY